jgi:hypothetical protein
VRAARPWTTFSAGTRPYRTGKRCCTASRRYTRYQASPMDGPACRVPTEPRNNRPASILQFFDMTTPFGVYAHDVGYLRVVAHDGNFAMSRG